MARPAFGVAWAADGEARPRQHRAPLAWAEGVGGGALLVRTGGDASSDRWVLVSEWDAWAAETGAAPVAASVADPVFEHGDGEGEGDPL